MKIHQFCIGDGLHEECNIQLQRHARKAIQRAAQWFVWGGGVASDPPPRGTTVLERERWKLRMEGGVSQAYYWRPSMKGTDRPGRLFGFTFFSGAESL